MENWLIAHEAVIRLCCFVGVLLLMAGWETHRPRRPLLLRRSRRWLNNLGLLALNTLLLRLLFPLAAVGLAAVAHERHWGLFNLFPVPTPWAVLLSVVALDLLIYLQHVMFHAVPALWRVHRVHHADLDYDVTTGLRFHPLEIVLSMLIKMAAVVVLGPPVVAVVLFEITLNVLAMFNHGNVALPGWLDRRLRWLIVTPDMHRVHHSIRADETNSNFGFNLSCWDRLLGTYRAQPRAGHRQMTIGIRGFREERRSCSIPAMLVLPFRGEATAYAINRRRGPMPDDEEG